MTLKIHWKKLVRAKKIEILSNVSNIVGSLEKNQLVPIFLIYGMGVVWSDPCHSRECKKEGVNFDFENSLKKIGKS